MAEEAEGNNLTGAKVERSLRERGFQTDRLTLSIARNLEALEHFAEQYKLHTLLTSRARATFAAMSSEECGHFIEFLQLSLHIGKSSVETREQWLSDANLSANVYYLASIANKPELLEGRARKIFQGMSPKAQRVTVMILMAALQVADRRASTQDRHIKVDVIDRMVEQFKGEASPS